VTCVASFFPWKLVGALSIERSALNFTQGATDVNPKLSAVRSTLDAAPDNSRGIPWISGLLRAELRRRKAGSL
jgi:hypothetical protein